MDKVFCLYCVYNFRFIILVGYYFNLYFPKFKKYLEQRLGVVTKSLYLLMVLVNLFKEFYIYGRWCRGTKSKSTEYHLGL